MDDVGFVEIFKAPCNVLQLWVRSEASPQRSSGNRTHQVNPVCFLLVDIISNISIPHYLRDCGKPPGIGVDFDCGKLENVGMR